MVRLFMLVLCLLPTLSQAAPPVTAESLRLMAGEAERQERLRASRVDPNDLSALLPRPASKASPPAESNKAVAKTPMVTTPVSRKYTRQADARPAEPKGTSAQAETLGTTVASNIYVPPSRKMSHNDRIVTDAVTVETQQKYGIRLGSWLHARLQRNTTSADPGRVEFVLTESYPGDIQTLDQGTVLFAKKAFNPATQRLDLQVIHAITPDGQEIDVNGLIYDDQRMAGLAGILSGEAATASLSRGMRRGLLDATNIAVSEISDNAVVNALTDRTRQAYTDDQSAVLDMQDRSTVLLYVASQDVLIRVEETF